MIKIIVGRYEILKKLMKVFYKMFYKHDVLNCKNFTQEYCIYSISTPLFSLFKSFHVLTSSQLHDFFFLIIFFLYVYIGKFNLLLPFSVFTCTCVQG